MWNSSWTNAPLRIVATTVLVAAILVLVSCGGSATAHRETGSSDGATSLSKVSLEVPTIWCSSCEPRVEANAKSVRGVGDVKFDNQTVIVSYNPMQTTADAIVKAIERGGDQVTKITKL